jgi:CBS domain-containing protein
MRRVDFIVAAREFDELKAEQFMQDAVYFYHKGDTVEKLAREMTAGGFGSVPVVDTNGQVIGIVTEFDILKAIREGKKLSDSTAVEIMTSNPLTVGLKTTAPELIQRLQDNHLIRMPVVDDNGKLVGIVARRDILEGYVKATIQRHGFWP